MINPAVPHAQRVRSACSSAPGVFISPEEDEQLNIAVSLSGLTKQDYIISKVSDRKINVQGTCKVHRAVYDRLSEVLLELKRIESGNNLNDELIDNINLIANLMSQLYKNENA